MCGITGIFDTRLQRPIDRALLVRMNESRHHRGPDEGGIHLEASLGLGHRRLSIIDLASGQQPLFNEDGTVAGRSVSLVNGACGGGASQISNGFHQRLIYHWYWAAGWNLTSPVAVKLFEAWDRLSHLGRGSALIAVSTPVKTTPADAEAVLTRFLTAMAPGIEQTLWRGD